MGEEDLSLLNVMPVVGPAAVLEHNKSPSISLSYRLAVDVAFGLLIIVDIFDGDDVVLLNNDRIRFICLCLGAWMRLAWSWLITKGSPGCRGPKRLTVKIPACRSTYISKLVIVDKRYGYWWRILFAKKTNKHHPNKPIIINLKESWRELVIGKRQGAKHHWTIYYCGRCNGRLIFSPSPYSKAEGRTK